MLQWLVDMCCHSPTKVMFLYVSVCPPGDGEVPMWPLHMTHCILLYRQDMPTHPYPWHCQCPPPPPPRASAIWWQSFLTCPNAYAWGPPPHTQVLASGEMTTQKHIQLASGWYASHWKSCLKTISRAIVTFHHDINDKHVQVFNKPSIFSNFW